MPDTQPEWMDALSVLSVAAAAGAAHLACETGEDEEAAVDTINNAMRVVMRQCKKCDSDT